MACLDAHKTGIIYQVQLKQLTNNIFNSRHHYNPNPKHLIELFNLIYKTA